MVSAKINNIIKDIQDINSRKGISDHKIEQAFVDYKIAQKAKRSIIRNENELVIQILKSERECFEKIFTIRNSLSKNAIETLIKIANDIEDCFDQINPVITSSFKRYYPVAFENHIDYISKYLYDKIFKNVTVGIMQGYYRPDLSPHLISRMYIAHFNDIMNPDIYTSEDLSFRKVRQILIDGFFIDIMTREGLELYTNSIRRKRLNIVH